MLYNINICQTRLLNNKYIVLLFVFYETLIFTIFVSLKNNL